MIHPSYMAVIDFKRALDDHLQQSIRPPAEVSRLETRLGEDASRDQAIFVTVVLKDGLAEGQRTFAHLQPWGDTLRRAVYAFQRTQTSETATAHIRYVTEAELNEPDA